VIFSVSIGATRGTPTNVYAINTGPRVARIDQRAAFLIAELSSTSAPRGDGGSSIQLGGTREIRFDCDG
jgi:hypothetical protein